MVLTLLGSRYTSYRSTNDNAIESRIKDAYSQEAVQRASEHRTASGVSKRGTPPLGFPIADLESSSCGYLEP